jgi:hypothetical protein
MAELERRGKPDPLELLVCEWVGCATGVSEQTNEMKPKQPAPLLAERNTNSPVRPAIEWKYRIRDLEFFASVELFQN